MKASASSFSLRAFLRDDSMRIPPECERSILPQPVFTMGTWDVPAFSLTSFLKSPGGITPHSGRRNVRPPREPRSLPPFHWHGKFA